LAHSASEAFNATAEGKLQKLSFTISEVFQNFGAVNLKVESNSTETLHNSVFMRACRSETVPYTPIWLMRQAGRYMQEYRDVRARLSFLELCKTPSLAAEVTVTAAERLGVDAAIIFADILLIIEPMGLQLEFSKGEGPVIHNPVRSAAGVKRMREVEDIGELGFVFAAIRETRGALRSDLPLIGFAGAPFTLASYIVEGGASKNYVHTKSLMYNDSGAWHAMMSLISRGLIKYLNAQVEAGAQAVQLFDSWVGTLSPDDYREYVLPHTHNVIKGVTAGTPVIHFGTGTAALLELMREAGGDVIGLDWRVRLDEGWQRIGHHVGVMGNLDPVALFANREHLRAQAKLILDQAGGRPGHIFNLGHGILPETPVENVIALVDAVREMSQESRVYSQESD
jgi:uroporphyrinogen decarboxylase